MSEVEKNNNYSSSLGTEDLSRTQEPATQMSYAEPVSYPEESIPVGGAETCQAHYSSNQQPNLPKSNPLELINETPLFTEKQRDKAIVQLGILADSNDPKVSQRAREKLIKILKKHADQAEEKCFADVDRDLANSALLFFIADPEEDPKKDFGRIKAAAQELVERVRILPSKEKDAFLRGLVKVLAEEGEKGNLFANLALREIKEQLPKENYHPEQSYVAFLVNQLPEIPQKFLQEFKEAQPIPLEHQVTTHQVIGGGVPAGEAEEKAVASSTIGTPIPTGASQDLSGILTQIAQNHISQNPSLGEILDQRDAKRIANRSLDFVSQAGLENLSGRLPYIILGRPFGNTDKNLVVTNFFEASTFAKGMAKDLARAINRKLGRNNSLAGDTPSTIAKGSNDEVATSPRPQKKQGYLASSQFQGLQNSSEIFWGAKTGASVDPKALPPSTQSAATLQGMRLPILATTGWGTTLGFSRSEHGKVEAVSDNPGDSHQGQGGSQHQQSHSGNKGHKQAQGDAVVIS